MVIFPCEPPIASSRSPGENVIDRMSCVWRMKPSWVCVDVSQKVTVSFEECARNSPWCERAKHESQMLLGAVHSEAGDPEDASNSLIVTVGYDKEVVVGPEETGAVPRV